MKPTNPLHATNLPDDVKCYQNALDAAFDAGVAAGQAIEESSATQEPVAWMYEDELPKSYPYNIMFPYSKVDGVRMFPVFGPKAKEDKEFVATVIEHHAFTDGIVRFDGIENMDQLPIGTKLYTHPQTKAAVAPQHKQDPRIVIDASAPVVIDYNSKSKRESARSAWVGLTDEEMTEIRLSQERDDLRTSEMLRKVEAKLKAKNERLEKNT